MIYVSLFLFASFWGLLWILRRDTLKRGKEEARKEMTDGELHDLLVVKNARDRLRDVDDSDRMLRDKYTRK